MFKTPIFLRKLRERKSECQIPKPTFKINYTLSSSRCFLTQMDCEIPFITQNFDQYGNDKLIGKQVGRGRDMTFD